MAILNKLKLASILNETGDKDRYNSGFGLRTDLSSSFEKKNILILIDCFWPLLLSEWN